LKILDRFLANIAVALGLDHEHPGMYESIQHLEQLGGRAQRIASLSERYRGTRNALAHNPDLTLRPEAATRIIAGVERIIRSAAETAFDLARRPATCIDLDASAREARDQMLAHGYRQLVVVDKRGKLVDVLSDRDIVALDSQGDLDGDGHGSTVDDAISTRDYLAVAPIRRHASAGEVAAALADEHKIAAVVTENGKTGEAPLGVITRGDLLRLQ
jgi:CBS domain-containing protein